MNDKKHTMTLEELQAEFPHGSRWTVPVEGPTMWRVVGWDPNYDAVLCRRAAPDGSVSTMFETRGLLPGGMRALAPCPITEPVTLQAYAGPVWSSTPSGALLGHVLAITLHPDGHPCTGLHYSYEGGPE